MEKHFFVVQCLIWLLQLIIAILSVLQQPLVTFGFNAIDYAQSEGGDNR